MIDESAERIAKTLSDAGLEIYRKEVDCVVLAERVRMHLMDSGVSVRLTAPPTVRFAVRCQRSDFPTGEAEALFERVRVASSASAETQGFSEVAYQTRQITDPMNEQRVLDTWLEIIYERHVGDPSDLTMVVRAALEQPKYIKP